MTAGPIEFDYQFGRNARVKLPKRALHSMVWKECRQNAPLLIIFSAVLILTLVGQQLTQAPNDAGKALWAPIVWCFLNVFALTIGVFLFAPEKENRTSPMLSQLPVTSGFVVRTKIGVGAVTVIAFLVICLLLIGFEQLVLGHRFSDVLGGINTTDVHEVWFWSIVGVIVPIEFFLFGALCSLFIRRTIFAVVVATVGFLFSWLLPPILISLVPTSFNSDVWTDWYPWVAFAFIKTMIFAALAGGLSYGGRRWLGNSPQLETRVWLRDPAAASKSPAIVSPVVNRGSPSPGRVYSSLFWQSFRQYRSVFLWTVGGGIPMALVLSVAVATTTPAQANATFYFMPFVFVMLPLIGALFAFSLDHQDHNYRFFQQHVEHGRKLWLSRLVPPALLSVVCAVALVVSVLGFDSILNHRSLNGTIFMGAFSVAMLSVFVAFSVGQFCSMFFRSSVFAFLAVLLMLSFELAWGAWLFYLNSNAWLFLAPMMFGMLAITWWRAPAWLADQSRIRERLYPWFGLALITVATVGVFAGYRALSVPDPDPDWSKAGLQRNFVSQSRPDRILGKTRSELFIQAAASINLDPAFIYGESGFESELIFFQTGSEANGRLERFLNQHQGALNLIRRADGINSMTEILDLDSIDRRRDQANKLRALMAAEASFTQNKGQLEQALKLWMRLKRFETEYPVVVGPQPRAESMIARWSELPGQSSELIKKAMDGLEMDLEEWNRKTQKQILLASLDFQNWFEAWKHDQSSTVSLPYGMGVSNWPAEWMPWEIERSKRIARQSIFGSVRRTWIFPRLATDEQTDFGTLEGIDFPRSLQRYANRAVPQTNPGPNLFSVGGYGTWLEALELLQEIQQTRYLRVRMALRAYQLEHGEFPVSLSELVPSYFEKLPVDVFYGREFAYAPNGKDASVGWHLPIPRVSLIRRTRELSSVDERIAMTKIQHERLIPANTPFLLPWSAYDASVRFRYRYRSALDANEILGECYDLSDPRDFLGSYPFFHTYRLTRDVSPHENDESVK